MYKILQWNCRGYRAKCENFFHLMQIKFYAGPLFQETMLNDTEPCSPNGYCLYSAFRTPILGNGLVTLFRQDIYHAQLDIQTTLYRQLLLEHDLIVNTLYASCISLPIKYLPCQTLCVSLTSCWSQ